MGFFELDTEAAAEAEKARKEEWEKVTVAWETAEEAWEEVWEKLVVAKKAWAAAWAAADAWEVEEKMRTPGKE